MTRKQRASTSFGLNALVWKEGNLFVAKAIEVEVTSQGKSQHQALANLQEALELYFEGEKLSQHHILPFSSVSLHRLTPKIQYA